MGNEFEVWSWVDISASGRALHAGKEKHLSYVQEYAGESLNEAMKVAKKLKKQGVGCVKIEWR